MIDYEYIFRVMYHDTDKMGTVHHSNYVKYYETARWELFRNIGISYNSVEEAGYLLPVIRMNFRFIKTINYDDQLTVYTTLKAIKGVRIWFTYKLYNQNKEIVNTAETELAFVRRDDWKPCLAPDFVLEAIDRYIRDANFKTTICIVRHGETNWNSSGRLQGTEDVELNDRGREQANETACYFEKEAWDIVVSSPLKRAFETAEIIASRLSLPSVKIIDEIKERSYGSASGLRPEEIRERFPDGTFPDQEDFEKLRERAMIGLNRIANEFKGKRIIVVSHGGLTNSILYTISGGEYGSFKTRLKNGCINKIILENNKWSVEFYNKTADELLNHIEN